MITSKGYKIPINHPRIREFKKELVVRPFVENAVAYPIYRISEKNIYLPKYYGIKKLGLPENIKEQGGHPGNLKFTGKLRDYQIPVCDKILLHLKENGSGLASLYTGWGKTCAAIWIAGQLNVKTLIVVHTENLLNQWKERIEQFLGEECGIIQGPTTITDKNVVIGMIQSISMKEYPPETFKDFGLCIFDEVHHTAGKVFSRVFYKIGAKYNLGLSATITRSDGLTKVIKYFIGEAIVNLKLNTIVPKVIIKYTSIEPIKEKTMVNGKVNIPGMINELCNSFMRTIEIVNVIKKKYSEGRKILVLTDRRNHCMELKRLLSDYDCGLYMGGMKNEALQESNKKRIIIATFHIASEGYDNPELDTLVFASPKSKIEQACGRILRQENENVPEIVDFVDPFSIFNNFYFSRLKFYKSKKYTFEKKEINKQNEHKQEIKLEKYSIIEE